MKVHKIEIPSPTELTSWMKARFKVNDTIQVIERINGLRQYWFISGLIAGAGISAVFLTKSKLLGLGIGLVNLALQASSLKIRQEVEQEDMKQMKEHLVKNASVLMGIEPNTVDELVRPEKDKMN